MRKLRLVTPNESLHFLLRKKYTVDIIDFILRDFILRQLNMGFDDESFRRKVARICFLLHEDLLRRM